MDNGENRTLTPLQRDNRPLTRASKLPHWVSQAASATVIGCGISDGKPHSDTGDAGGSYSSPQAFQATTRGQSQGGVLPRLEPVRSWPSINFQGVDSIHNKAPVTAIITLLGYPGRLHWGPLGRFQFRPILRYFPKPSSGFWGAIRPVFRKSAESAHGLAGSRWNNLDRIPQHLDLDSVRVQAKNASRSSNHTMPHPTLIQSTWRGSLAFCVLEGGKSLANENHSQIIGYGTMGLTRTRTPIGVFLPLNGYQL